jgi:hypothetical protein
LPDEPEAPGRGAPGRVSCRRRLAAALRQRRGRPRPT